MEASPSLDDSAWDAFWGWDCAGPKGLCDRVYQHLQIPRAEWPGLKHLPTASDNNSADSQADLIKQNRAKLDTALDKLPAPSVVTASEVAAAAEKVADTQPTADQFASQAGVDDEKDEDLVRDLNRMRSQKQAPSEQADRAVAGEQPCHCTFTADAYHHVTTLLDACCGSCVHTADLQSVWIIPLNKETPLVCCHHGMIPVCVVRLACNTAISSFLEVVVNSSIAERSQAHVVLCASLLCCLFCSVLL